MPTYEPGTYHAEIIDQGFAESGLKKTPYFFIAIRIKSRGGRQGPCPQFERVVRQYLNTDVGQRILREDLRAVGVEVTDFAQLSLDLPEHISLIGLQIEVRCDHEEYAGQTRERWRVARPTGQRMSLDAVRALSIQAGVVLPPPAPPADEV